MGSGLPVSQRSKSRQQDGPLLDDCRKSPIIHIGASIALINTTFRMLQSGKGEKGL
jgi:hypothetical protein